MKLLVIRIDPKIRYLTEIAARAKSQTLTDYIEAALLDSFKRVSLDPWPELDEEPEAGELTPSERLEKFKLRHSRVSNPLSELAESLWSEHPFVRLQLLAVLSGHLLNDRLMSPDDKAVWDYIFSQPNLNSKDGKLMGKLVAERWAEIKVAALASGQKAKGRGK